MSLEEPFKNDNGKLVITEAVLDAGGTSSATTTIQKSKVHDPVTVTGGTFRYDSNQYSGSQRAIESTANDVQIIDSVFIGNGAVVSLVDLHKTERLAFCTFVDQPASSVTPYSCDPVSPNSVSAIINAVDAQTGACSVDHSLFNGSSPGGAGNVGGTASSFFVNLSTLDLHLAAGSPALHGSTGGIPGGDHDIEGNARPQPSASAADVGAYESPN